MKISKNFLLISAEFIKLILIFLFVLICCAISKGSFKAIVVVRNLTMLNPVIIIFILVSLRPFLRKDFTSGLLSIIILGPLLAVYLCDYVYISGKLSCKQMFPETETILIENHLLLEFQYHTVNMRQNILVANFLS